MYREKKIVDRLVLKHKTSNPFDLCSKMNIKIIFASLGSVRGFYRHSKRCSFITINSSLLENEQRTVCAHELGHFVLHKGLNTLLLDNHDFHNKGITEIQADRFCNYLLNHNKGM